MGMFDNNYQHRGVLKTPHEKKGFFKFWEVYGRHMWKLLEVNLLYLLFCLPVVTIGPATAAMTKNTKPALDTTLSALTEFSFIFNSISYS